MTSPYWTHAVITPPGAVAIIGEELRWTAGSPNVSRDADRNLLNRFLALSERPEGLADFVRSYGALRLCREHGLPSQHNTPVLGEDVQPCQPRQEGSWYCEPAAAYLNFANEAARLCELAERNGKGDETPDDFRNVSTLIGASFELPIPGAAGESDMSSWFAERGLSNRWPAEFQRTASANTDTTDEDYQISFLDSYLERWHKLGNVRLHLAYDGPSVHTKLFGDGTFGALALQLASRVTARLQGVNSDRPFLEAVCSECGTIFVATRKPNPNRNCYCPGCGRPAAVRNAQRNRREKIESQRKVETNG